MAGVSRLDERVSWYEADGTVRPTASSEAGQHCPTVLTGVGRVGKTVSQDDGAAFADETTTDKPAVGLVATPENTDYLPAAVLRARQAGHQVLATAYAPDCDGLAFARSLGAVVVPPPESPAEADDQRDRLGSAAQTSGYPGLIYQADPSNRVDFAASCRQIVKSNQFVVKAREESSLTREPRVLVGIPAYNEATTIDSVVRAASRHADDVLVVDDGSDDQTAARAEAAGAAVVRHEQNSGYGAALKSIFRQARRSGADQLIVIDGDGQHDANDIPNLVERQRDTGVPVVIGSRFGEQTETNMPLYRRVGLGVVNVLTNVSLGLVSSTSRVRDTQSGFRAYSRQAIESIADDDTIGDHMDASTDILHHANAQGYTIDEVPTTIDYSFEDTSSRAPVQHGIMLVMNILRTIERERPITMVGLPGVGCTLVGFGFFYWGVLNYVRSGTFPAGLALAAAVFVIVGIFAGFTAIILHSLALYRK